MSQHPAHPIPGHRIQYVQYENPNPHGRQVSDVNLPVRSQYQPFDTQFGEFGRAQASGVTGSSHMRAESQQPRSRFVGVEPTLEHTWNTPQGFSSTFFDTQQISSDLDQMTEFVSGSFPVGSPKSNPQRGAKPLYTRGAIQEGSDDNNSTATTAVESGNDSDVLRLLQVILSTLSEIQKGQAECRQRMQTLDIATTTRLSDFRDHMEKKLDNLDRGLDDIFNEMRILDSTPNDEDSLGTSAKRTRSN